MSGEIRKERIETEGDAALDTEPAALEAGDGWRGTVASGGSPLAACERLGRGALRGELALERHAAG